MRRLFVCNNPYQIIVSLVLVNGFEHKGQNDIIICDRYKGANEVYTNLKRTDAFNNVFLFLVNEWIFPSNLHDSIRKVSFAITEGKTVFRKYFVEAYDELYYNNDDIFFYSLLSYLLKMNNDISVYRFEEGYSSYINPFCSPKAKFLFESRHGSFDKYLKAYYFFEPNHVIFQNSIKKAKIVGEITDSIKSYVKKIFNIQENYPELNGKWVFFEESFFVDYGFNDDVPLILKIIELIGKDNIIIKLHPRTKENRFARLGLSVFETNGIPWEAIRIGSQVDDLRLITLASGSVINSKLLLDDGTISLLLYHCVEGGVPSLNNSFERFVEKLLIDHPSSLYIPSNTEQALSLILSYQE